MELTETLPTRSAPETLGGPLYAVLTDLRRVVRRSIRDGWTLAALSPAQVEMLRVVRERPGVGVSELAGLLHVAPNTVSTIVSKLVGANLLRREADPSDARVVRLRLTPGAHRRGSAWRHEGGRVLDTALRALTLQERAAIAVALPAMEHLVELLVTHGEQP